MRRTRGLKKHARSVDDISLRKVTKLWSEEHRIYAGYDDGTFEELNPAWRKGCYSCGALNGYSEQFIQKRGILAGFFKTMRGDGPTWLWECRLAKGEKQYLCNWCEFRFTEGPDSGVVRDDKFDGC